MCDNEKSRSKFMIDAVVQAAAPGSLNKFSTLAGLAGFVLRLFRSRVTRSGPSLHRTSHRSATVRPGSRPAGKGGRRHG